MTGKKDDVGEPSAATYDDPPDGMCAPDTVRRAVRRTGGGGSLPRDPTAVFRHRSGPPGGSMGAWSPSLCC
ncbi:hypothetical protein [Streptomyces sp. NPDC008125]|uniref:hypothetical protein n=1 Tax=Streptomyces sp. NPDC008125 TaxID=3364811 RepID=UPI0036F0B1BD